MDIPRRTAGKIRGQRRYLPQPAILLRAIKTLSGCCNEPVSLNKTMRYYTPEDYNNALSASLQQSGQDYNRYLLRCRLRRYVAIFSLGMFAALTGVALGAMVANGASVWMIVIVTVFGGWGIREILTRHQP